MRVHVCAMLGNLLAPSATSVLMPLVGPWPLLFISAGLILLSAVFFLFIPETSHHEPESFKTQQPEAFESRVSHALASLKESFAFLKQPSFVLLLLTFLNSRFVSYATLDFLSQFASKRYHIKLERTGYIQTAYGAAHIIVLLLIIPYISQMVLRPTSPKSIRMTNEKQRDLVFSRWSYAALGIGALIMGISPSLPGFVGGILVMALGSGAGSYMNSTISLFAGVENTTRVFSLVAIVETIGAVYAKPALAGLFTLGMRLGGTWIGLPYIGVAGSCVAVMIMLLFLRLPATGAGTRDDEESSPRDPDSEE
jgi:hypothetical protein